MSENGAELDAWRALDLIDAQLRLLASASFTGTVTLHFRAGIPKTAKRESHHGADDGFALASGLSSAALDFR